MTTRAHRTTLRAWNEVEVASLIKMRELGRAVRDIAVALNRLPQAVYDKSKHLIREGRLLRNKAPNWTSKELELLKNLSLGDGEVASKIRRTVAAVITKRVKMHLLRRERNPWTMAQDENLTKLRDNKLSLRSIAIELGRSESAISNRIHGLIAAGKMNALSRRERGHRGGLASTESREDRWTSRERQKIIDLWQSGHTANEISTMHGRSARAINSELGNLRAGKVIARLSTEEACIRRRTAHISYSQKQYAAALQTIKSIPDTKTAGYVIGVLYGDGFITIQGNRGSIGLKTTNKSFCRSFARALEETFGRKTHLLSRVEPLKEIGGYVYKDVTYYEAFLHSVHLGKAIRQVFGLTDEKSWRADPVRFLQIGSDFIDGVIQGFFDAEGSFMCRKEGQYYTTACSMNEHGLKSIHALLRMRGYKVNVCCDKRKQWKVGIGNQSDVRRFAAEIGSRIDYKAKAMEACLSAIRGTAQGS